LNNIGGGNAEALKKTTEHSLSHTWGAPLTSYDGQERFTSSEVIPSDNHSVND